MQGPPSHLPERGDCGFERTLRRDVGPRSPRGLAVNVVGVDVVGTDLTWDTLEDDARFVERQNILVTSETDGESGGVVDRVAAIDADSAQAPKRGGCP
jgi:hypothetical protein